MRKNLKNIKNIFFLKPNTMIRQFSIHQMTFMPALTRLVAIAAPMPALAPVTTATLPTQRSIAWTQTQRFAVAQYAGVKGVAVVGGSNLMAAKCPH